MNVHSLPGPENIARRQLPNGIVALARENHTSPAIVIEGYVAAGSADEQADQSGLSAFTASLLLRGTTKYTFEQINELVEGVGARVSVSGGLHKTHFSAKCLAEDFPLILNVLAEGLLHPVFPPDQTEKVRGEILTRLRERDNDTRQVARLTFRSLAYPPAHPYSRSMSGYRETIEGLTRNQLANFYQTHYGPREMLITVVGAIDHDAAIEAVERTFGTWKNEKQATPASLPALDPILDVRRQFKPLAGKTQTDIVLGYLGPPRRDPDYLAGSVANMVLGGFGLMGRLGDTIRDEQGLAYYVYSRLEGGLGPGPWATVAGVNPRSVEQSVQGILAEIERLVETPVSPEELSDVKAYMTGSLPLRLETNEGVAMTILDMELYQLGLDYLQRYSDLIQAITAEDAQRVASQYLRTDGYALAIAGPPNDEP
ncbi:MAG: insulinase family protein [Chloroflexi bacterium]|nr:insulinase family protein [Chloroflexota bacterium]